MKKLLTIVTILFIGSMTVSASDGVDLSSYKAEHLIVLEVDTGVSQGEIIIVTRPAAAPKHVARIKELAREGFYEGLTFHRVIRDFMAQGGDPNGDGTGGSGQMIDSEFSAWPHLRGTVAMARNAVDENSADSQFYITYYRRADLDDNYTVWGRVIKGMNFVDDIPLGEPAEKPAKIVRMRVASDIADWHTRLQ